MVFKKNNEIILSSSEDVLQGLDNYFNFLDLFVSKLLSGVSAQFPLIVNILQHFLSWILYKNFLRNHRLVFIIIYNIK